VNLNSLSSGLLFWYAELERAQAFLNAVHGLEIENPIPGDSSLPGDADPPPSE
jgi:hypothetical protein